MLHLLIFFFPLAMNFTIDFMVRTLYIVSHRSIFLSDFVHLAFCQSLDFDY